MQICPYFCRVIIDDADNFPIEMTAAHQFFEQHIAGFSGADNHCAYCIRFLLGFLCPLR